MGRKNGRRRSQAATENVMARLMRNLTSQRVNGCADSWWSIELLAAGSLEAWVHPEWVDTMQRWYKWLYEMKKKGEEKRMEVEHWSVT